MKILEVITDTNIGGAGILLATRCEYMDRSKYEVIVALPQRSRLRERFVRMGISVVEINGCYDRSFEIQSIPKWIAILKNIRPEIVNCHGCLSCRIAARLCHVPILFDTRHCAFPPKGWQTVFPGKNILGLGMRTLSDQTIAVADAAKQNLLDMGADSRKIKVIINGAKPIRRLTKAEKEQWRAKTRISMDSIVIGIFGRLESCKGHDTFLRAAKLLLEQNTKYQFLIVGDGRLFQTLKSMAGDLGILNHTIFVGFVEDVAPYFNITDILVNCSTGTETSSLALSEGMSLGIPVVASDFGGNPYMIKNGENGFLFPMNQYDVLAKQIQRITENSQLYGHLSKGAKLRFDQELNARRMTRDTEELYDLWFKNKIISAATR